MDNPYVDHRGKITDLLVTEDFSITHITFNRLAVRGNHLHEKTVQYDFVLKGKLLIAVGDKKRLMRQGDSVVINPGEPHAYLAEEDSEMVSICFGVRKGGDYEKDVVRLTKPLL